MAREFDPKENAKSDSSEEDWEGRIKQLCPLCGQALVQEKCKVVCRSAVCGYRIVYNCSEF